MTRTQQASELMEAESELHNACLALQDATDAVARARRDVARIKAALPALPARKGAPITTAAELVKWATWQDELGAEIGVALTDHLTEWGWHQACPDRLEDWSDAQATAGRAAGETYLDELHARV